NHRLGNHARPRTRAGRSRPAVWHSSTRQESEGRFVAHVATGVSDVEVKTADAVDEFIFRFNRRWSTARRNQAVCGESEKCLKQKKKSCRWSEKEKPQSHG